MKPATQPEELPGLRVTVDRIVYRPIAVAGKPHSFVYFITIHNDSTVAVVLQRRKWVVTHADGQTEVVVGDGIVGQTPAIEPGDQFTYNSQHLIPGPHATATGAYLGADAQGRPFVVRIPPFKMSVPRQV